MAWVAIPRPKYRGLHEVEQLTADSLQSAVLSSAGPGDTTSTWLVMYAASWNPSCDFVFQHFAELSASYALSNLRFGWVDVGQWPEAAKVARVNDSATAGCIPSFVLYVGGQEQCRLPRVGPDGKVKRVKFDKRGLEEYFALPRRHMELQASE